MFIEAATADTETVITPFLLHNLLPHQILSWLHNSQVVDKLVVDAPLNQQVLTSPYVLDKLVVDALLN